MEMTTTDWIQAISMVVLVIVTAIYAWRTHVMSKAAREQAEASAKMADEMREQRLNESQPYLLIRLEENNILRYPGESNDMAPDSITITIRNEGKGPAINIRAGFWHPSKTYGSDDKGYLASGEQWQARIKMQQILELKNTLYLPELKGIITRFHPEPIVVKCEDINKRQWISCLYFNWSAITEGYVSAGEQIIMELKND
jgi:hypothetical protein